VPKPLSTDLRQRIIARWQQGGIAVEELADVFMVSESTIRRLLHLHGQTGSIDPRAHGGGRKRALSDADKKWLRQLVQSHPDWTTYEFTDAFNKWAGRALHRSIILRAIRELGFTRKKSRYSRPNATASESKRPAASTSAPSKKSTVRVLFSWTKRAPTLH
jgi:transposase